MSTSTYTIGQVLDHARRIAALNAASYVTEHWFNDQRTKLAFTDRQWSIIFEELSDNQREATTRAFEDARAATEAVVGELFGVVTRMRGWRLAGIDDQRRIAQVRCAVDDGDIELRQGHLREAHHALNEAASLLRVVADGRKRNSARSERHLTTEMVDEMHEVIGQLAGLADMIGAAA